MTIRDLQGRIEHESKLPSPLSRPFAINTHQFILSGNLQTDVAFLVVDTDTGKVVHQEKVPAGGRPGSAQTAVHFARAQDAPLVAVACSSFAPSHTISFYDTRNWQMRSSIAGLSDAGIGPMALSNDGTMLAFGTPTALVVVDVSSGSVLRTIPLHAYGLAFSPDNRTLAVLPTDFKDNEIGVNALGPEIVRLSDGTLVASHPDPASWSPDSILWDPKGRFLVFFDSLDTIRVWDPRSSSTAEEVTLHIRTFTGGIALSPNGSELAVGNGNFVTLFSIGD